MGLIAGTLSRSPLRAMDVGAAGGVSTHWREYLPLMEIDCFEPDADEWAIRSRDAPANVHWFRVALAGTTGRRDFYVLNRATGSSLYPPNDPVILEYSGRAYAGVKRVIQVDCLSLKDFLVEHRRPTPLLLKLDTQGTELEILSSLSPSQLDGMFCIEMEVEFLELYKGQPTFQDVHSYMLGHGFRLLDLRTHRSYRNAGGEPMRYLRTHLRTAAGSAALSAELVAGDALYVRDPLLVGSSTTTDELMSRLFVLRMYRFYDLAFWMVEQAARERLVSPSHATALMREIAHGAPKPTLAQRVGLAGTLTRRLLWAAGRDDNEVFWTRRRWPNQ